MFRLTLIIAALAFLTACPDLPADQHGTLQHIKDTAKMRIGLIENPPWVIRMAGEPAGAEVELIRRFASQMGVEPEWHWGGEASLMPALENYELDAVIGGLSDKTPWSTRVGITRYYFSEKYDVGVPAGTKMESLSGKEVSVHDARTAGYVRQKRAVPVMVDSVQNSKDGPPAAPDWQIAQLGLARAGFDLHSDRHVIAVPPGENQMVKRLEEFLSSQYGEIPELLAAQPEVPR